MLKVQSLSVARGARVIVENCSFSLNSGEGLHVCGPNGAGKSTLLKAVSGLIVAETGSIRNGFDAIIYLGHQLGLHPDLSAHENANSMGWPLNVDVLDFDLQIPIRQLSEGQQRRVALQRFQISATPSLWVLDEPFVALDTLARTQLSDHFNAHLGRGGGLILTAHDSETPAGYQQLCLAED